MTPRATAARTAKGNGTPAAASQPAVPEVPQVKHFPPVDPAQPAAAEPARLAPADTRMKYPATIQWVPVRDLGHDEAVNTRPVDENWVIRKGKAFNWMLLGTITVSLRDNGDLIIIDGQHRARLVEVIGGPGAQMKCEVIKGLSRIEEAELFIGLSDSRAISAISRFNAQVTAQDPLCSAVARIVRDNGWIISPGTGPGRVTCVNRLLTIHSRDLQAYAAGGPDPVVLGEVLQIIDAAWGKDQDRAGHEAIVWSLGRLLLKYGQKIRTARIKGESGTGWLIGALREAGASPQLLLARADAMASLSTPPITVPNAVLRTMIDGFNYGASPSARLQQLTGRP